VISEARLYQEQHFAVTGGHDVDTGYLVIDPEHWREQAESIRRTASSLNNEDAKARMLRIAEGYEMLKKQTEERRQAGWKRSGA
jgi:hypothetical protein